MRKYLCYIAYTGSYYSGIQCQYLKGMKVHDPNIKTVQNELQKALRRLKPDEVTTLLSSRTDAGVHALSSAVQFTLHFKNQDDMKYCPYWITNQLNRVLDRAGEHIKILKVLRVADDFHCQQKAVWRRYMYRLAVKKTKECDEFTKLPPLEQDRCCCVRTSFDMEKFLSAAQLISGTHDFSLFTTEQQYLKPTDPVKKLTIGIRRGQPLLKEYHSSSVRDGWDFVEVHVESRSFMYKQVRRIVGAMLSVARGKVSLDDLKYFLETHTRDKRKELSNRFPTAPSSGLFLKEVLYNPKDLLFIETSEGATSHDQELYNLWTILNAYQQNYEHYRHQSGRLS